jgi:phospholipid/cholesterol/gamma-HCH transport system substrate-binding protein
MATQRQKVQVGIFLLVCSVLLVGTLIVASGWQREATIPYLIEFDESVSGLFYGSDVRYRGVPVGRVTSIAVLPTNRIRVQVEVRPSVIRIREGMVAQLGTAGVTGQLYIDLTGGEPDGKRLPAQAVIPSRPSLLANLSTELPTILGSINSLLVRIEQALGEEGRVAAILRDVGTLVPTVNTTVIDVGAQTQALLQHADNALEKDIRPLIAEFKAVAQTTQRVLDHTEASLKTTLASGTRTFQQLEKQLAALDLKSTNTRLQLTLQHLSQLTERLGHTSEELNLTLQHIRGNTASAEFHVRQSARSLQETLLSAKQLLDYLERDPSSLLLGRRTPASLRDGQRR